MRAWDIPGWNTGAKIRRKKWSGTDHVHCVNGMWWNRTFSGDWGPIAEDLLQKDDWELCQEPKKKVKVKMYRPVYAPLPGMGEEGRNLSYWREEKYECPDQDGHVVIGWQETEIEYEEI